MTSNDNNPNIEQPAQQNYESPYKNKNTLTANQSIGTRNPNVDDTHSLNSTQQLDDAIISLLPVTCENEDEEKSKEDGPTKQEASIEKEKTLRERCQVEACQTNRKVVGICTQGFCCSGRCQTMFCAEHDGSRLNLKSQAHKYKGRVCNQCAYDINRCRSITVVFTFSLIVLTILAAAGFVAYLKLK